MPRRGNFLTKAVGRAALRLWGWSMEGDLPNLDKAVVIVVPHTSNWDFPVGLAGMYAIGVRFSFFGKSSLFRGAAGPVMEWLGGIPVDRSAPAGVVDQIVEKIDASDHLLLAMSPEGTRSQVDRWKTGFYHIALKAGVPIVPIAFDWRTRVIRFGDPLMPSGDMDGDLAQVMGFFKGAAGKRPEGMAVEEEPN